MQLKLEHLKELVLAFGDRNWEHGLPESVYSVTYSLIRDNLGEDSAEHFSRRINAIDGAFFTRGVYYSSHNGEELWKEILAKRTK